MIIRKAEKKDISILSEMMARAFAQEPMNQWLYKDEEDAIRRGKKLFEIMARQNIKDDCFYTTDDLKSAVYCLPPKDSKMDFLKDAMMMVRMALLLREKVFFLINMFRAIEALKPKEPFFYVQVLGVHPSVQREGRGRLLLEHVLKICDANGWMAYLENADHLVPYYERFGFNVRQTSDVPEVGVTMYTMSRLPKKE